MGSLDRRQNGESGAAAWQPRVVRSFLIAFLLLIVVASLGFLLMWSDHGEPTRALLHGHDDLQREPDSPAALEEDSDRIRVDPESMPSSPAGTGQPAASEVDYPRPRGWRVTGRVLSTEGKPIAAAAISLHYWGLPDNSLKGDPVEVISDDAGCFQVFLPIPPAMESHASSSSFPGIIAGRAWAAGFLPARTDSEGGITSTNHPSLFSPHLPEPRCLDSAHAVGIDFELKAGAVIQGRAVTADGIPVEGALINVKDPGRDWHHGGKTDRGGIFFIPIESAGEHRISAEKTGVGVARATSFTADADQDVTLPDMILLGTDSLSGTVLFPDGAPIEGLTVSASLKKPVDTRPRPSSFEELLARRHDRSFESLLGCAKGESRTDSTGSFLISGLHPGRYEVKPDLPGDFEGSDEIDCEGLEQEHQTGTSKIVFTIPIHMMHACLRDEEGCPLPGTFIFQIGFSTEELNAGDGLVKETTNGPVTVQVLPGEWTVWAFSNRRLPVKKTVTVGLNDYLSDLEFVLPSLDLSGYLRLPVKGSDGKPIDKISLSLYGESPRSESSEGYGNFMPLLIESLSSDEGIYEFPAPAGTFFLTLSARGISTIDGMAFPGPLYHRTPVEEVEVVAGKRTLFPVTLQEGGLVRLTLHFDRSGTNFVNIHVKAFDETRDADTIHIGFAAPGDTSRIRPTEMESGIPYLGLKLLRPGLHRLEVDARGYPKKFKKTEVPFTILPGKVTDVEVWVEADESVPPPRKQSHLFR